MEFNRGAICDFTFFADKRLNENSSLQRGCGGVGLIWRKSLPSTPISFVSDRICGIQLDLNTHVLSILCVYLPSTDHDIDEYKTYLNELECAICALQSEGSVIVAGDCNAHLPSSCHNTNAQGQLLHEMIDRNYLYPISCSSIATGPKYTYFSGLSETTVDCIFIDSSFAPYVNSCQIATHDPLNVSDHLPISISIHVKEMFKAGSVHLPPKINWSKAVVNGSIHHYAKKVQSQIAPLLNSTPFSVRNLENEIPLVVNILLKTAQECLPHIKSHKKKFISDSKLSKLCKLSKIAWKHWKNAGRPNHDRLYTQMKKSRRAVRKHITACRARKERSDIQKRDLLFKNRNNHRFRIFKPRAECSKLMDENQKPTTDSSKIIELFRTYFSDLASSRDDEMVSNTVDDLSILEANSFTDEDQILDVDFVVEEVETALKALKCGRSKGADGLSSEHLVFGGSTVVLWLMKIFNSITYFEEIPPCLKEGVIIPIYKGKGKDPLLTNSYRGITLSSVIAKTFEIAMLKRLSPFLEEIGFPDINQTAFQRGISCTDAIFSTQEVLLNYIRQGDNPFLCFYDIEKAFDSVEFPVLFHHLYSIGITGKTWHLIKAWYHSPTSRVKLNNCLSAPFSISRGVKQGSVLSPSLFLVVMNSLLQRMRSKHDGGSLHGIFAGTAVHADDVRSIAPSIQSVISQYSDIHSFTSDVGLKLNASKLEVIQISQNPKAPVEITLGNHALTTKRT